MKEEPVRLSLGPDLPEVSRVGVLGLARSGRAAVTALLERGVDVVATDARSREALSAEGELPGPSPEPGDGSVEYVLEGHPESFLDGIDLLIVSPGVPTSIPVLWAARARAIAKPVMDHVKDIVGLIRS